MKYLSITVLIGIIMMMPACVDKDWPPDIPPNDFSPRQEMKTLVKEISFYSKTLNTGFLVIPQNGENLVTDDGKEDGDISPQYMNAIDGLARENLYYGYSADNLETAPGDRDQFIPFLNLGKGEGKKIMVTDYCWTHTFVDNSYLQNNTKGYISFAAPSRDLDEIPAYPVVPYGQNSTDITQLSVAANFLYLNDPGAFGSKTMFLDSLGTTNYDVLVIDLYFNGQAITPSEVTALKTKANGGARLVLGYLSIGQIENNRYYWDVEWNTTLPSWIGLENPERPGNYYVEYWNQAWKDILYGNDISYVKRIIDAGFDGVLLDGADHWEYFLSE